METCILKPSDKLHFIHIPKTAGTSLISLLDMHFHHDEIFPAQLWHELVQLPLRNMDQYRLFRGHFGGSGLDQFLKQKPLSITMLRDPIALAVSTYEFILRESNVAIHKLVVGDNMSFEAFINHPETISQIRNKQVRNLSFCLMNDSDTDFLLSSRSRKVVEKWLNNNHVKLKVRDRFQRAIQKLEDCVFFGLVERFDDSMALMSYTFGWAPTGRTQQLRKSTNTRHRKELSKAIFKKVEYINSYDRILYEHAKTLFNERFLSMKQQLLERHDPSGRLDVPDLDDHETLNRFLDRHYQCVCGRQKQDRNKSITFNFSDALNGQGWHRREIAPQDNSFFRWTGPECHSAIDLDVSKESDLIIYIKLLNAIDPCLYETFSIYADDYEMTMAPADATKYGHLVFKGFVLSEHLNRKRPFLRLTVSVEFTDSKEKRILGDPDTRSLGLAVNWIHVGTMEPPDIELPVKNSLPDIEPFFEGSQPGWFIGQWLARMKKDLREFINRLKP